MTVWNPQDGGSPTSWSQPEDDGTPEVWNDQTTEQAILISAQVQLNRELAEAAQAAAELARDMAQNAVAGFDAIVSAAEADIEAQRASALADIATQRSSALADVAASTLMAQTARDAALAAQGAAETARTGAQTAQTAAAGSATAAAGSATAADTSALNAAASAAAALTSAGNAHTSELAAAASAVSASGFATNANTYATNANNSLIDFRTRYLGVYAADPATDPYGGALAAGMLYFRTSGTPTLRLYTGTAWTDATANVNLLRWRKLMAGGETVLTGNDASAQPLVYTAGYEILFVNGSFVPTSEYTQTNANTITLSWTLSANDEVVILAFSQVSLTNVWTQAQADARYPLLSTKGAANGFAGLDANGKVPVAQLPTQRTLSVTGGTSINLANVDVVIFSSTAAHTITTFSNVEPNKLYVFVFTNSNSTIARNNAWLDGGTNKTPTADDVMLMLGVSATTMRQAAPVAVNA
jgi:hypothetical protein